MPTSIYAYVDGTTGEGLFPHHGDNGDVDLEAVRKALAGLITVELPEEIKGQARAHLLAHLREAGEAVAAESRAGAVLELEARVGSLDRTNRELRQQLDEIELERTQRVAAGVDAEVANLVRAGKITPAVAPRVAAILKAGPATTVNFEGRRADAATLLREILEALPAVVDFSEKLTFTAPAERVPLSRAEKSMLDSLGVSEADYRRYAPR